MSFPRVSLKVGKWKSEQVGLRELPAFPLSNLPTFCHAFAASSRTT